MRRVTGRDHTNWNYLDIGLSRNELYTINQKCTALVSCENLHTFTNQKKDSNLANYIKIYGHITVDSDKLYFSLIFTHNYLFIDSCPMLTE